MPTEMQIQLWLNQIQQLDKEINQLAKNKGHSLSYTRAREAYRHREEYARRLEEAGIQPPVFEIKETL